MAILNLGGRDAQGHPIPYQRRQNAGITSKHSFSDGSRVAAECLKTQFEDRGAAFRFTPFLEGLAFNLVCRYNAIWRDPVPGRNDDGSGTISILNITQTGMIFRSNVELVALAVKNAFYWDRRHTLFFHEQGHTATKSSNLWAQISDGVIRGGMRRMEGQKDEDESLQRYLLENVHWHSTQDFTGGKQHASLWSYTRYKIKGLAKLFIFPGDMLTACTTVVYVVAPGGLCDRPGFDLNQIRSICQLIATPLHLRDLDEHDGTISIEYTSNSIDLLGNVP
ncbi:hypothetical protein EDC04DRAFT_2613065 [Pisolithus marmoratus]|nr:hypothetical protein EDC04DRAFT_2613065 [Pisolithus marmoratus]